MADLELLVGPHDVEPDAPGVVLADAGPAEARELPAGDRVVVVLVERLVERGEDREERRALDLLHRAVLDDRLVGELQDLGLGRDVVLHVLHLHVERLLLVLGRLEARDQAA